MKLRGRQLADRVFFVYSGAGIAVVKFITKESSLPYPFCLLKQPISTSVYFFLGPCCLF